MWCDKTSTILASVVDSSFTFSNISSILVLSLFLFLSLNPSLSPQLVLCVIFVTAAEIQKLYGIYQDLSKEQW